MKARLFKIPFPSDSSFLYKKIRTPYINDPWHFHNEYELILIERGKGTKFIGNNVSRFRQNDLSFIGSNIPHLYRNDEEYYLQRKGGRVNLTYVHFTTDFLGHPFFNVPEMSKVRQLLNRPGLALEICGKTKEHIIETLRSMGKQPPERRLLSLLDILISLSHSNEIMSLLPAGFIAHNNGDTHKINYAFEYILKNYTQKIYVKNIASELNMSIAAFSKYFKHYTRKTFSGYITEIRIGHACRLIMENNYTISEIGYLSGFENLSNFYRHFKKIMRITPKQYKNHFLKNLPG